MNDAMMHNGLKPLIKAQLDAVMPADNIWLSASAGTGKTQVLTARVIRLLLEEGVEPENLLCITFTKAGASEMAERINQLLASWVQLDEADLANDLQAVGADFGPATIQRARQLFAKVLDAPGGGLQILTIHSFCQSLLGSFPEEAGLVPGFKPVEGREQQRMLHQALSEMILAAELRNDDSLIRDLQSLSLEMGEDASLKFLHKAASAPDVMAEIPQGSSAVVWARRVAGVRFDEPTAVMLAAALEDGAIDRASIEAVAQMNIDWCKGKPNSKGASRASAIHEWLKLSPEKRAAQFLDLHSCWTKANGEPIVASKGHTPMDEAYCELASKLNSWSTELAEQVSRARYADRLARALLVGKAFADQYATTKQALGVVDFDDMIRKTADLLTRSSMADWVRYKLDRQVDHILVDEAQDTNKSQWDIVRALSDDFFSGASARPDRNRTIFAVGDFKQAIYGFQGTAPERYREAGADFASRIADSGLELRQLTLSQSFRSTSPVLDFVNAVIEATGGNNFGIIDPIEDHYSQKPDIGLIELLATVTPVSLVEEATAQAEDDEESWVTDEKRRLAEKLADHVKGLIDERPWLVTKARYLQPGDIMFLLRSRGDLASLLVAQLHERGVPVAGIDRLRLLQPLVVQDMLAAVRFVLQPADDLSLASLLVSPLIGWSQEKLLAYGYRGDSRASLWQHLREQPDIATDIEPIRMILAKADFSTAYHFLEQILSGPIQGRRKFASRLGSEALVPMEEMLNAAMQFEQQQGGGLQAFLAWFDRGDIEIKRDGESGANEVRVMTVHGAKGLQAPVVILADTTSDPGRKSDNSAELLVDEGRRTPLLPIRKVEQSDRLLEIVEKQRVRELQEHKRLLYVAITRAEERLIMGGALGVSRKGEPPSESWYAALEKGLVALGCTWEDDTRWGGVMRHVGREGRSGDPTNEAGPNKHQEVSAGARPAWLDASAPQEERPPRPLVPSRIDDDDYGDAPAPVQMRSASERGIIIHSLLERVTNVASLAAAERWLDQHAQRHVVDKNEIMSAMHAVVDMPEWQSFFGPGARAEVPLAAVVGETVITGRIDRMVIQPGYIRILDFKSGRSLPRDEREVSVPYLRQMAHYVAALEAIFPGHVVEASLLYTHGPLLITLSHDILDAYKPGS
ncbi:MAG: double-strand break repair helicase AddA [Sphingorhabdus sp.]